MNELQKQELRRWVRDGVCLFLFYTSLVLIYVAVWEMRLANVRQAAEDNLLP